MFITMGKFMQKILVIGGSQGISAAIVELAQADFEIITISRTSLAKACGQHFVCDITNEPLPAIDMPLSGLVYCPGSINLKPFASLKLDDFRVDLEINTIGAIRCLQHYLPNLKAADSASVVLFSSVAVQTGLAYHATVAASKGAIEGLTRTLAAEWAPAIRVNAIAPSLTDTPLAERLLRDTSRREAAAARHPLKRIGSSTDIAQMAVFLLSDKASWITGQIFAVDGGVSAIKP
jgi:3-oxoacyl-[acyl-carrier protein] reductase